MTDAVIEHAVAQPLIRIRDEAQRLVDVRLTPWGVIAQTEDGPETFERGAYEGIDPTSSRLRVGSHRERSVGVGVSIEERDDAAYATYRVVRTRAGDEALAELADGLFAHASVAFAPGENTVDRAGVVHRVRVRALPHVAIVEAGAYGSGSGVVALRESTTGVPPDETPATDEPEPETDDDEDEDDDETGAGDTAAEGDDVTTATTEDVIEERAAPTDVPAVVEHAPPMTLGSWASLRMRQLDGDRIAERALADITTAGNAGVVPAFAMRELIGIIDASRPLINGLRRIPTPDYGLKLTMPKIGTRPVTGEQTTEKSEVASGPVTTTIEEFDAHTFAGAGDLSVQLLRRSSPAFLALYMDLLAEALAAECEDFAAAELIAGVGGSPITIDPAVPASWRGVAWANTYNAVKKAPDRLFLSPTAAGAFLGAQAGDGRPMYPWLGAGAVPGSGSGSTASGLGNVEGLAPIIVPALEATAVDVIIGWSGGAVFTEDGSFELSVDVPAKLGRDIALATIAWFGVIYPGAFTLGTLPPVTPLRSSTASKSS